MLGRISPAKPGRATRGRGGWRSLASVTALGATALALTLSFSTISAGAVTAWQSTPAATFTGSAGSGLGPVALAANGHTALVGAPNAGLGGGAAYIYTESGSTWSATPTVTFTGATGGELGSSVALSANGQTALVSAPGAGSGDGAVYVYAQVGGTWSTAPVATFKGGSSSESFGYSVALSGDGQTAIVGAPAAFSAVGPAYGAAYVYSEGGGSWSTTPTATFTVSSQQEFGSSLALSANGQTALVGAPGANSDGGAVYVYDEVGGTWSTIPAATFSGTLDENLGGSVALSTDGQNALVGAPAALRGNGAAYVYNETGGSWSATPAASFSGTGDQNLGGSVALSGAGQSALVGAPGAGSQDGAAYVYDEAAGTWSTTAVATFTGSSGELLGHSVALSGDDQTALLGAPYAGSHAGAAYVYDQAATTTPTVTSAVKDATTGTGWAGTEVTGATAYDTATVTGSTGTPGGTVTYGFFGNNGCSGTALTTQTVTLSAGIVPSSNATPALAAGSYSFEVSYSSNSSDDSSTPSACEPFSVAPAGSSVATMARDSRGGWRWNWAETTGSSVYDTATVSEVPDFTPTGTLTYSFFTNGSCTGRPSTSQTVTLNGTRTPGSKATRPLDTGAYSFQANYSGDPNYLPSTSDCEPFTVAKAPTNMRTVVYDARTGRAWYGTEVTGASAYDSAELSAVPGFAPTGTVTYSFFKDGDCAGNGASTSQVDLSSGNVPSSATTAALSDGRYSFEAAYSGDLNYLASTSYCETFDVARARFWPHPRGGDGHHQ